MRYNRERRKYYLLIWICIIVTACNPAAHIESVYLYNDTSYLQYEKSVHNLPISFVVDTANNDRAVCYEFNSHNIDTICFLNNIMDEQDYISCINKIVVHGKIYYQLIFSEDVVGTDFFMLFDVHSGKTYISSRYNFQAEPYSFDIQTLNMEEQCIDIVYVATKYRENVHFFIYDNQ